MGEFKLFPIGVVNYTRTSIIPPPLGLTPSGYQHETQRVESFLGLPSYLNLLVVYLVLYAINCLPVFTGGVKSQYYNHKHESSHVTACWTFKFPRFLYSPGL